MYLVTTKVRAVTVKVQSQSKWSHGTRFAVPLLFDQNWFFGTFRFASKILTLENFNGSRMKKYTSRGAARARYFDPLQIRHMIVWHSVRSLVFCKLSEACCELAMDRHRHVCGGPSLAPSPPLCHRPSLFQSKLSNL